MADEPRRRPPFFALAYLRLASDAGVAKDLGPIASVILTTVALAEDKLKFARSVGFWNGDLAAACGCGSEDTLARHRAALSRAGWLSYVPGGRGRQGRYRTAVPPEYAEGFLANPAGYKPPKSPAAGEPNEPAQPDDSAEAITQEEQVVAEIDQEESPEQLDGGEIVRTDADIQTAVSPAPVRGISPDGPHRCGENPFEYPHGCGPYFPIKTDPTDSSPETGASAASAAAPVTAAEVVAESPPEWLDPTSDQYDPLKAGPYHERKFIAHWNASGLVPYGPRKLGPRLLGHLLNNLRDPDWAEDYPAALVRLAKSDFYAKGEGRKCDALNPLFFLTKPHLVVEALAGLHDPRKKAPDETARPVTRVTADDLRGRDERHEPKQLRRPVAGTTGGA